MNNRGTEKIYPINANNTQKNHNSDKPSEDSTKKGIPSYVLIIELVLSVLLVAFAALSVVLLTESNTHESADWHLPITLEKEIHLENCTPIDVSEIPESYMDSFPLYDFTLPVPESEPVDYSYFNDTVFIGDSRTQGLLLYSKLTPKFNFAAQGATTQSIRTKPYIALHDGDAQTTYSTTHTLYTLSEALTAIDGQYKAIYISAGVNELGWNTNIFTDSFRSLILAIREHTNVPIYIQLILPVTAEYAETSIYGVTNEKQREFNSQLTMLAAELSVFFLDPCPAFSLEDGSLNPEYASFDGAHLSPAANKMIAEYYLNHVVDAGAYSNLHYEK